MNYLKLMVLLISISLTSCLEMSTAQSMATSKQKVEEKTDSTRMKAKTKTFRVTNGADFEIDK